MISKQLQPSFEQQSSAFVDAMSTICFYCTFWRHFVLHYGCNFTVFFCTMRSTIVDTMSNVQFCSLLDMKNA